MTADDPAPPPRCPNCHHAHEKATAEAAAQAAEEQYEKDLPGDVVLVGAMLKQAKTDELQQVLHAWLASNGAPPPK